MHSKPNPETLASKSIAAEVAELRSMQVPELVARYEAVFGKPPRVKHRDWLWRRIAWKIQEQRYGGLSTVARRRLDELIAEMDLPLGGGGTVIAKAKPGEPPVGTVLTRVWHGVEVRATKVQGGWECRGKVHRSLSALVRDLTGSHCNGRSWFRLPPLRRKGL